jgi:hypothetical protein
MKSHQLRFWAFVPVCLLLYAGSQGGDPATGTGLPPCPNGLIEGPDPIGRTCIDPTKGGKTNTGMVTPEFGLDPLSGQPYILFGDAGDIAFQIWTGNAWSPTEYVASTSATERDPRAFVAPNGAILVTWWADGRDPGVFYAVRDLESQRWSPPMQVTGNGSRPSIATVAGRVLVVFERPSARGVVDLIAATEDDLGGFTEQTVRTGAGAPGLDSRVHDEDGQTWVEWQAPSGHRIWSQLAGGVGRAPGPLRTTPGGWERSGRDATRSVTRR